MKRIVLSLTVTLLITAMAWADPDPTTPPSAGTPTPLNGFVNTNSFLDGDYFDAFYAPRTLSTEARYSAGIFSSDVDDFIDVNSYDPKIGTFFFLGGYPSVDTNVKDTNILTNTGSAKNDYAVSFGLGKTINSLYLGVYYGGSFVYSHGTNTGGDPDNATSNTVWRNNLAVLVGTSGYGAFRFDLIMDTEKDKATSNGDTTQIERWESPSIALTWGGLSIAGLDPYVTLGYRFPYKFAEGDGKGKETTTTEESLLGLQAGVSYDLSENSSVSGDFIIGGEIGGSKSGDYQGDFDEGYGGVFLIALQGAYSQTLEFGKVSVGFSPNLALGYKVDNSADISGDTEVDAPSDNYFELTTGVDLGVKFQATRTIAVYTGASLRFFDWIVKSHSGGDTEDDSGEWGIDGIRWSSANWAILTEANLGIGMTISPAQGLVIGCGLNTLLDKFFMVDLEKMQVRSGDFWNTGGSTPFNIGSYLGYAFNNLTFDLTVSYKF
jgi:hypothetical protein